jgi:succinoglycan biosynthesis transport protein ExoP
LLDSGTASDLPAELLTARACAVLNPDVAMTADARAVMSDQLRAAGFADVKMLSGPLQAPESIESSPRVVAA